MKGESAEPTWEGGSRECWGPPNICNSAGEELAWGLCQGGGAWKDQW